jgi:tetratricopeptide (TPR) repeat protein
MPRVTSHPAEAEILALEMGAQEGGAETALHVAGCRTCTRRKESLARMLAGIEETSALEEALARPAEAAVAPRDETRSARLRGLSSASDEAMPLARRIIEAARESDQALGAALGETGDSDPDRLALLYAPQEAGRLAASEPHRALALARALLERAATLPETGLVAPRRLAAEASLLASQALLNIGRLDEARGAVKDARIAFAADGDEPFDRAVCAYLEGTAAAFQGQYGFAERQLKLATRVFAGFEQDAWTARAEGALGTLYSQRGNPGRAVPYLESALERFGDGESAHVRISAMSNLSRAFALLGDYGRARATQSRALAIARQHALPLLIFRTRLNLAEVDFFRGETESALEAFDALATEADEMQLEEDQVYTRLYAAECLGRLSRPEEVVRRLRDLRSLVTVQTLAGTPVWSDLASRLDRGDVTEGLLSSVQSCLEFLSGEARIPAEGRRRRA